jgi:hypothetical protein
VPLARLIARVLGSPEQSPSSLPEKTAASL